MSTTEEKVIKHEEELAGVKDRLDRIENNQNSIFKKVSEVREKIFDGYDLKITNTNQNVSDIRSMLNDIVKRENLGTQQVEAIIDRKILYRAEESRKEASSSKRWLKQHRIELLSVFVAVCTLVITFLTVLRR